MTPEERAARAARLRALMEDGELKEAFDAIERDISAEWKRTFDANERENLWRSMQLLEKLRQHIRSGISAGLSAQQLTDLRRAVKPR